ncbi:hypothetical protein OR60_04485 [Xanthomonas vesicatoria]|nr:hypothetical protein OR60_04485 [Xanthomonas vesicatoria]
MQDPLDQCTNALLNDAAEAPDQQAPHPTDAPSLRSTRCKSGFGIRQSGSQEQELQITVT